MIDSDKYDELLRAMVDDIRRTSKKRLMRYRVISFSMKSSVLLFVVMMNVISTSKQINQNDVGALMFLSCLVGALACYSLAKQADNSIEAEKRGQYGSEQWLKLMNGEED